MSIQKLLVAFVISLGLSFEVGATSLKDEEEPLKPHSPLTRGNTEILPQVAAAAAFNFTLPKEVWGHHIFPFLKINDLLHFRAVCRSWRAAAWEIWNPSDPRRLPRPLDLSDKALTKKEVQYIIQGSFAHVILKKANLNIAAFLILLQSPHIKFLDFESNNIEEKDFDTIDAFVSSSSLPPSSPLRSLNLAYNKIGDKGVSYLAFTQFPQLTYLNLRDNNIKSKGGIALAAALKGNATLTKLDLGSNSIRDAGGIALAEVLKSNATLTKLNLGHNNISNTGCEALAAVLKVNTTLTKLDLALNSISATGCEILAETLKINATLIKLDLGFNSISDIGCKALAEALKVNATLTRLNLRGNSISDTGCKALAAALKVNATLTELNLDFNNISSKGCKALAAHSKRILGLKY